MIYCFDLDMTLCLTDGTDYHSARPIPERVLKVNDLHSKGHYIKIFTARGSESGIDFESLTSSQLRDWGVNFHELILGKPAADIYVDDKGVSDSDFFGPAG